MFATCLCQGKMQPRINDEKSCITKSYTTHRDLITARWPTTGATLVLFGCMTGYGSTKQSVNELYGACSAFNSVSIETS